MSFPFLSLQFFPGSDCPAILGMGCSKVRAQFVSDVTKGRRKEGKRKSLDSLIRFSGCRSSESMTWTSYQVSFLLPLSKTLVPGWPFPSLFCILLYVLVLFVHVTEACGLVRAELHHLFCQTIPFSPFLGHRAHWVIKSLYDQSLQLPCYAFAAWPEKPSTSLHRAFDLSVQHPRLSL